MSLLITDAGIAASIQAGELGIKYKITHISIGTEGYVPSPNQESLRNEIQKKEITRSECVALGQLHFETVWDSDEQFEGKEIGYWLEDGTLFAVDSREGEVITYKQKNTVVTEAVELNLSASSVKNITVELIGSPHATEELTGIAKIATVEQVEEGEDDTTIVTPYKLKNRIANKKAAEEGLLNTVFMSPLRVQEWWTNIKTTAQSISGKWDFTGELLEKGKRVFSHANRPILGDVRGGFGIEEVKSAYKMIMLKAVDGRLYVSGDRVHYNIPSGDTDHDASGYTEIPMDYSSGIKKWFTLAHGALVLMNDGTLWGWGVGEGFQLPTGNTNSIMLPTVLDTQVEDLLVSSHVTFDHKYSMQYYKKDNKWYGWGKNKSGRLGNGSSASTATPTLLGAMPDGGEIDKLWSLGCDFGVTFALSTNGKLYASGYNGARSCGIGNVGDSSVWSEVLGFNGSLIKDIKGGYGYNDGPTYNYSITVFLLTDGTVWTAGSDFYGALGRDGDATTPASVGLSNISEVICVGGGGSTVYAIEGLLGESTKVHSWGYNGHGQVGNNKKGQNQITPYLITLPKALKKLAGNELYQGHTYSYNSHVIFWFIDDTLMSLGCNGYGQTMTDDGSVADSVVLKNTCFYEKEIKNIFLTNNGIGGNSSQTFIVMEDGRLYGAGYGGDFALRGLFNHADVNGNIRVPRRLV